MDVHDRARCSTLRIVQTSVSAPAMIPIDVGDGFRIDLSIAPRGSHSHLHYADVWAAQRAEPIGDLFIIPPGLGACINITDTRACVSMVCLLESVAIPEPLARLRWTDQRLLACLDVRNPHIRRLAARMREEVEHPGLASEALLDSLGAQLAIEIYRFVETIEDAPASGGLAPWRLRLVDERLSEARPPPNVGELSQLCGMSARQFTRAFRVSKGCSPGDYVAQRRIERAQNLLIETDDLVDTIAQVLGFASASSFTYAFRSATGVTPSEFRANARAQS